jgi:hypothetical protein
VPKRDREESRPCQGGEPRGQSSPAGGEESRGSSSSAAIQVRSAGRSHSSGGLAGGSDAPSALNEKSDDRRGSSYLSNIPTLCRAGTLLAEAACPACGSGGYRFNPGWSPRKLQDFSSALSSGGAHVCCGNRQEARVALVPSSSRGAGQSEHSARLSSRPTSRARLDAEGRRPGSLARHREPAHASSFLHAWPAHGRVLLRIAGAVRVRRPSGSAAG